MRTRKEIIESLVGKTHTLQEEYRLGDGILEVLLDIRDLLAEIKDRK